MGKPEFVCGIHGPLDDITDGWAWHWDSETGIEIITETCSADCMAIVDKVRGKNGRLTREAVKRARRNFLRRKFIS